MSAKRTTDPAGRPGKEVKNMDNEKEMTPGAGWKNAPKSGEEKNNKNLVLVVPETRPDTSSQGYLFWSQEEYEEACSGEGILLKRIYKLTDENQAVG